MKSERIRTLKQNEGRAHFNVLNLCYGPWGEMKEWKRRYVDFPNFDITKNVLVVEENGEWVGGGTAWFRDAILNSGRKIPVYLAGDLYVHPAHRGKGIYSTAMRNLNKMASEEGRVLGFAFPSTYRVPAAALPKYGFVGIVYPITKILVLNPEKFIDFLFARVTRAYLPRRFDDIRLKVIISFGFFPKKERVVTRIFELKEGQFSEISEQTTVARSIDLTISANVNTLLKIVSSLYLKKKGFLIDFISAILRRKLKIRFSWKFLKILLRGL